MDAKVFMIKDINLYIRGGKLNNRHFNFSGIKDINPLKQIQFKKKKRFKGSKLHRVCHRYLILPRLHHEKARKKIGRDVQCKVRHGDTTANRQHQGCFTHSQKIQQTIGLRICNC